MIAARYASLIAFAQSRGSDCGREPDGKFGGGNKCAVVGGVLRPQSTEPHEQEPSFGDKDDDHVYHVTTQGSAASIMSEGFKQSGSTVKGGAYETYSKGKLFFTEKSGLATWKSKIENHLFHSHDDPPPVAIVRVKKAEVEHLLQPDELGTKDAGAKAYYVDLTGKKQSRAFCPTGVGNGVNNSCGTAGGSGASYAIASDAITQSIPEADRESVRLGLQRATFSRDQLEDGIPFKSTTKVAELQIRRPEQLLERAESYGIKNPSDIAVIGCGTIPDSKVVIVPRVGGIDVKSTVPLGDDPLSTATVDVGFHGEPDSAVKYGYFQLTSQAMEKVNSGVVSLPMVSATLMSAMSQSLEAAEKNGLSKAVTNAAGNGIGRFASGPSDALQGYRLWPKFGFDADVGSMITERFMLDTNPATGKTFREGLSYEAKRRASKGESLRVQEIIETKQGEEWWNKHGSGTEMTLDFSDKSSLGYRRYREMLSVGKKMAARLGRQGRSAFEFWLWAAEETGMPEFRNCEQALFPERRAFCATGVGGGVKNDCSSSNGGGSPQVFPEGSQNLRDAVDSVAPAPEQVWDRSRGLAETPPPKQIDDIASEQTSHSGAALTPEAEASYGSLVDEIGRQYEALTAAGLKARAWRGDGEPYGDPPGSTKPNSNKMREEVAKTGEFSFFMTDKGFGTGDATPNHPMLRETKYKTADGEPMIANDLFRVVHDMVAHVRGGYSFSTNGEYNGMLTHASTLPEAAWPALFAETFGQNAVYEKTKNYAPQNAYASKVGPEIIRSELKKRTKSSRAAKDDGDEPLGYQHIKSRPALLKSLVEQRAFCATGDGNGIDNSCGAKTTSAPDKDGGGGTAKTATVNKGVKPSSPLSPKNKKSWMNPSGDFYPVASEETHNAWAAANTSGGKLPDAEYDDAPAGEHLFKSGWLRIADTPDTFYIDTTSKREPSGVQKKNAIDFAIHSGNYDEVLLTNDGWIKKTLWRKSDDRAFCPNGSGNGVTNDCGADSSNVLNDGERLVRIVYRGKGSRSEAATKPVVDGLKFLSSQGVRLPKVTEIGTPKTPGSCAEYYVSQDKVVIREGVDWSKKTQAILDNWTTGDPDRPLESVIHHETSHASHWDSLDVAGKGSSWGDWAEAGTQSWEPSLRVSKETDRISAEDAIEIAGSVSGYAKTNPIEFVAEVSTGAFFGKNYDARVWSLYRAYGGPSTRGAKASRPGMFSGLYG